MRMKIAISALFLFIILSSLASAGAYDFFDKCESTNAGGTSDGLGWSYNIYAVPGFLDGCKGQEWHVHELNGEIDAYDSSLTVTYIPSEGCSSNAAVSISDSGEDWEYIGDTSGQTTEFSLAGKTFQYVEVQGDGDCTIDYSDAGVIINEQENPGVPEFGAISASLAAAASAAGFFTLRKNQMKGGKK
jgi:hypothetical protein